MKRHEIFEQVADRYSYDPASGDISRRKDGVIIGAASSQGYRLLKAGGRWFRISRVAWFLHYGTWPEGEIDHINGDRTDNRIANLRDVSASVNRMNQSRRSDNTSGVPGVMFHSGKARWIAQICAFGRRRQLGTFKTKEEAIVVRLAAQRALPFGPNHGSSR